MRKLLMIMLFLAGTSAVWAQDGQARFIEVQGKVEIKEAGSPDWKNAVAGDSLTNGTIISTYFKSAAIISLGASQLTVRPLTMLTLEELVLRENSEETSLYLRSGRIQADINQPTGLQIDFSVRSAYGSASVRGTSFVFDGRYLWVDNGIVRLENNNRQKVYVAKNQQSYLNENNLERVIPPFEAEEALLEPRLPELDKIGRQKPAMAQEDGGGITGGGGGGGGGGSGMGLKPIWP